ncbi:MAG: hypothetical protein AUI47_09485 [Acidobacteria bacterium 13_1_40CM_2_68_5]|nr:MAG: hypothetical protein AUI47_09485 [Acidobacteria bacterium 13_1_40CM_2_68_5]
MRSRLRVIVTGLIAQYPLGGVTWDYVQYLLGFARLGHDVYYLEDTGQWPYNPVAGALGADCAYNVGYLAKVMSRFGLDDRWAYRFADKARRTSEWFGLSDLDRAAVVESADLLVNLSCALERCERYRRVSRLVLIDTDPVFTQIKLARGQRDFAAQVDAHDAHFSFGECLSDRIPRTGHRWRATRQPIVLSEWRPAATPRNVVTTVMNWTSYRSVAYGGRSYGQKDVEFMRFLELPGLVAPTVLEVAVGPGKTRRTPRELLTHKGWRVVDPARVCPDVDRYRDYIQSSLAEWSVAKNGYVVGRPGWFSGRSACYLAAAKPVIVQDTGVGTVLPVGQGILTFDTLEAAADAIREVESDYDRHARAAREIAEACFDSGKVLSRLLEEALA